MIARGGGSLEDLAPFNDEPLARLIAASHIPVISAIGHETDFTIADFVADLRAPTPSAAAELVTQSKREVEENLARLRQRLGRATRYQLIMAHKLLATLAQHGAMARIRDVITRRQQRVDDLSHRLARSYEGVAQHRRRRVEVASARLAQLDLRRVLAGLRREIDARSAAIAASARSGLLKRRSIWQRADGRLSELSPTKILERGYALVFDAQGNLLKDSALVQAGDEISARLARGTIAAVVKKL